MTGIPLFHVDAFTSRAFAGNPAAVCLLEAARPDRWMQQVAAEMNLSETAFVCPDGGQLRLRWMTPTMEVDLCGHATLATAHVLKELAQQELLPETLRPFCKAGSVQFVSRSGRLAAEFTGNGITLDFPASDVEPETLPEGLAESLGLARSQIQFCGRTRFDYLVRLATARDVRQLNPSMNLLAACPVRGVIVTALGDSADHDFISRFFAPASGIDEDPVTGSAHCALAPYWAPEFGRQILFGYQASARGGHVRTELRGDRVRLSGQAVTVLRGELLCRS